MISHVVRALRWYFMWRIRSISAVESGAGIDEESMNELREKRTSVLDELRQVSTQRPSDEVRIQVCNSWIFLITGDHPSHRFIHFVHHH